jgi:hypothetical protein
LNMSNSPFGLSRSDILLGLTPALARWPTPQAPDFAVKINYRPVIVDAYVTT